MGNAEASWKTLIPKLLRFEVKLTQSARYAIARAQPTALSLLEIKMMITFNPLHLELQLHI